MTAQISVVAFMPEHVEVDYETTGPQGGDAGHGGETKLTLRFESGSRQVRILEADGGVMFDTEASHNWEPYEVEITVRGDWEMAGFDLALKQLGIQLIQRDLSQEWTEE